MKDPLDSQTLDLVDASRAALTPAQRQKRRRDKLRDLKAAEGLREYRLTDFDVAYLLCAVDDKVTLRDDAEDLKSPLMQGLFSRLFERSLYANQVASIGTSLGVKNIVKRYKTRADEGWKAYNELIDSRRRAHDKQAQRIMALEKENARAVAECASALKAVEVLQARLHAAGLSPDYLG